MEQHQVTEEATVANLNAHAAKVLDDVVGSLEKSIVGIFATKDSMQEAHEFANELAKATGPDQIISNLTISIGIYHNTLISEVLKLIAAFKAGEVEGDDEV